jgi:predicted phage terminase large subunit-like protein
MEQEPGSSGVGQIDYYARQVLNGYPFWGVKSTGPKAERAVPVSSAAEAGNVKVKQAPWNNAFLDEFEGFPQGSHDDQVDAVSGAFQQLRSHGDIRAWKLG